MHRKLCTLSLLKTLYSLLKSRNYLPCLYFFLAKKKTHLPFTKEIRESVAYGLLCDPAVVAPEAQKLQETHRSPLS